MSEVKFKVGDLVYCPHLTGDILALAYALVYQEIKDGMNGGSLPLFKFELNYSPFGKSSGHQCLFCVDEKGRKDINQNPVIFHATQENYELLSKLYPNVDFEPPPKKKEPKEIIWEMLNSGYDVVNYIADGCFGFFTKHHIANISKHAFDNLIFSKVEGCLNFKIITQKGEAISDFIDGEVVLESENE